MEKIFSVGKLFKTVRIVFAYKQKDFAQSLGISQGYVSKIEKDLMSPDVNLVINFSKHFNISMDVFKLGYLPTVTEGPGMSKIMPVKFRENGYIRLGIIVNLLEGLEKVTGQRKVESFLSKMGIQSTAFCLPNMKVNSLFMKKLLEEFNSHVFNRDLYLSCYTEKVERPATINDFENYIVNESFFKVEKVIGSEEKLYLKLDESKLAPETITKKQKDFLEEFNLEYMSYSFSGNFRVEDRQSDNILISLAAE